MLKTIGYNTVVFDYAWSLTWLSNNKDGQMLLSAIKNAENFLAKKSKIGYIKK